MSDHPWCKDVARDEAVRAAEDAVPRPAVPDWREIPERVAALEREVAAMRAPVVPAAEAEAEVERLKCDECSRSFSFEEFNGGTRRLVEPDNAFGPERWETLCPACVCKDAIRERDAEIRVRDAALARVAELEAQAKLAPAPNVGGGANQADAEPVAWAVVYPNGTDGLISFREEDAADVASVGDEVVPLYRAPPQPRGWLTEQEIAAVRFFADWKNGEVRMVEEIEQQQQISRLLARNAPPKVRMPDCVYVGDRCGSSPYYRITEVLAALAAAGVEVCDE